MQTSSARSHADDAARAADDKYGDNEPYKSPRSKTFYETAAEQVSRGHKKFMDEYGEVCMIGVHVYVCIMCMCECVCVCVYDTISFTGHKKFMDENGEVCVIGVHVYV